MPKRPPCPQGYPWLMPYLVVKDADLSLAFYAKAFGFEKRMAMPGPDGKTMHAEMMWKDGIVMFGPFREDMPHRTPAISKVVSPIGLYLYCEDVDAMFKRAIAAGAKEIKPPQDQFYGDRTCTVEDPDGYQWSFATNVADFDPSKAPQA